MNTTNESTNKFTVIASVAMQGTLKSFQVEATDAYHAFGVVAQSQNRDASDYEELEFLVALQGHQNEGETFTFPGEGIVCEETVLEQSDVFGPK